MSRNAYGSDLENISLMRTSDKRVGVLFLALFAISVIVFLVLVFAVGVSSYNALPAMAMPFIVIGLINYALERRYATIIFIVGLSVFLAVISPELVLFLLYIFVCAEGLATMVEIVQRLTFYKVLRSVEYVNVKKKLTMMDRVIVFFFNIPVDLDTRNLTIDSSVKRSKLPWKDMINSILLALLFCVFLWIYVFLNPAISISTSGVPIYTFTIVLYLALLVMPWSIFSSLNVRIETDYRAFHLYGGLMETMKRMFLPIFAALLLLVSAISANPDCIYYIGMSFAMIVVSVVFTSVMYYTNNEIALVNDILDVWERFHPSSIYSAYDDGSVDTSAEGDVPGTPKRDPSDCFKPILRNQAR